MLVLQPVRFRLKIHWILRMTGNELISLFQIFSETENLLSLLHIRGWETNWVWHSADYNIILYIYLHCIVYCQTGSYSTT